MDRLEYLISRLIKILEVKQLDVKKKLSEEKLCCREVKEVTALLGVVQKALDLRDAALRQLDRLNEEDLKVKRQVLVLLKRNIAVLLEERKVIEDLSKDLSELFLKWPM